MNNNAKKQNMHIVKELPFSEKGKEEKKSSAMHLENRRTALIPKNPERLPTTAP
jgi:hypothetical protein